MFEDIGGKIKVVARVSCYIGIVSSFFGCLANIVTAIENYNTPAAIFWLVGLVLFPVLSWIGSFFLYGFGQLVENSDTLLDLTTYLISLKKTKNESNEKDF